MSDSPHNNEEQVELNLDDNLTYEIYHLVGAVANTCHASGLLTSEEDGRWHPLPDFDDEVKEIMRVISVHIAKQVSAARINENQFHIGIYKQVVARLKRSAPSGSATQRAIEQVISDMEARIASLTHTEEKPE